MFDPIELAVFEAVRLDRGARGSSHPREKAWSSEEETFLRENAGVLYDAEIAGRMERTVAAVHIRRQRAGLPSPLRHPDFITANRAAAMLGVDAHKVSGWIDSGLLPGVIYAKQGRPNKAGLYIRRVRVVTFKRWITRPLNWIYFDPLAIPDPALRRLAGLAYARWDDEWWTTRQLADYHGLDDSHWVQQKLHRGEIPGVQAFNRGGRQPEPAWSNWFIRRSDAVQARFITGKGDAQRVRAEEQSWSPRADAWILRARAAGMIYREIAARMGPEWNEKRVFYRYKILIKELK